MGKRKRKSSSPKAEVKAKAKQITKKEPKSKQKVKEEDEPYINFDLYRLGELRRLSWRYYNGRLRPGDMEQIHAFRMLKKFMRAQWEKKCERKAKELYEAYLKRVEAEEAEESESEDGSDAEEESDDDDPEATSGLEDSHPFQPEVEEDLPKNKDSSETPYTEMTSLDVDNEPCSSSFLRSSPLTLTDEDLGDSSGSGLDTTEKIGPNTHLEAIVESKLNVVPFQQDHAPIDAFMCKCNCHRCRVTNKPAGMRGEHLVCSGPDGTEEVGELRNYWVKGQDGVQESHASFSEGMEETSGVVEVDKELVFNEPLPVEETGQDVIHVDAVIIQYETVVDESGVLFQITSGPTDDEVEIVQAIATTSTDVVYDDPDCKEFQESPAVSTEGKNINQEAQLSEHFSDKEGHSDPAPFYTDKLRSRARRQSSGETVYQCPPVKRKRHSALTKSTESIKDPFNATKKRKRTRKEEKRRSRKGEKRQRKQRLEKAEPDIRGRRWVDDVLALLRYLGTQLRRKVYEYAPVDPSVFMFVLNMYCRTEVNPYDPLQNDENLHDLYHFVDQCTKAFNCEADQIKVKYYMDLLSCVLNEGTTVPNSNLLLFRKGILKCFVDSAEKLKAMYPEKADFFKRPPLNLSASSQDEFFQGPFFESDGVLMDMHLGLTEVVAEEEVW